VGQHHRLVSHPRKKRKKRTKPPEQWAYSVEFPVDRAELPLNAKVTFEVVVQRGSVGIGILKDDGSRFLHEVQISEKDGPFVVHVHTKPAKEAGSLIIRDTASEGLTRNPPAQGWFACLVRIFANRNSCCRRSKRGRKSWLKNPNLKNPRQKRLSLNHQRTSLKHAKHYRRPGQPIRCTNF
jgi:hypothetical protein